MSGHRAVRVGGRGVWGLCGTLALAGGGGCIHTYDIDPKVYREAIAVPDESRGRCAVPAHLVEGEAAWVRIGTLSFDRVWSGERGRIRIDARSPQTQAGLGIMFMTLGAILAVPGAVEVYEAARSTQSETDPTMIIAAPALALGALGVVAGGLMYGLGHEEYPEQVERRRGQRFAPNGLLPLVPDPSEQCTPPARGLP